MIATTGFFDGVHKGHVSVLERIVRRAKALGEKSAVVTFWPHPRIVLGHDAESLRLLTSLEEKKRLLRAMGIDEVIVIDFTLEFSRLTAGEFISEYLSSRFGITELIIGYDHKFGRAGSDPRPLEEICAEHGIRCVRAEEFSDHGLVLSSTKIRHMLESGDIPLANESLGYDYMLGGTVVKGRQLGRKIGFPTANLALDEPLKLLPSNGVYSVEVVYDGKNYRGICNIGNNPTVAEGLERTIEVNILDFDREIYCEKLEIIFKKKIRDEKKFISLDELSAQIKADVASIR